MAADARNKCRSTDVERSEKKSRSRELRNSYLTYFCMFWFVGMAVNPSTKFDVSKFTDFRDTGDPKIIKVGPVK